MSTNRLGRPPGVVSDGNAVFLPLGSEQERFPMVGEGQDGAAEANTAEDIAVDGVFLHYYLLFLGVVVCKWVTYLFLPRGAQQSYFGAHRRRRKLYFHETPAPELSKQPSYSVPRSKSTEKKRQVLLESYKNARSEAHKASPPKTVSPRRAPPEPTPQSYPTTDIDHPNRWIPHPRLSSPDNVSLLQSTWKRLHSSKGLKFMAHGVKAASVPIWIRLSESVLWWTKGSHSYALRDVLWMDVLSNTPALQGRKWSLSIRTPTGSLDVTAQSQSEWQAVTAALSRWLDLWNANWREYCQEESVTVSAISSNAFG